MNFDVYFTDRQDYNLVTDSKGAKGKILLKLGYKETFFTALHQFSKLDYMRQWIRAVELLERGEERSAIITTCVTYNDEIIGEWWPMYLASNRSDVIVQNGFMLKEIMPSFEFERFHDYVWAYEEYGEEGKISSWNTTLEDLIVFKKKVQERISKL